MKVILTTHAVHRYQQRVRPSLDVPTAKDELERLLGLAATVLASPPWSGPNGHEATEGWLLLTPEIVCPLVASGSNLYATTVLTRGTISEATRKRRRQRKREGKRKRRQEKARERDWRMR